MKHFALLALLLASSVYAATPQNAVVSYTAPAVDATHSAATSCTLDRGATAPLGVVTPGATVTSAAPDYGGPYTFRLTCSNAGGATTPVTFTVSIPAVVMPPNPPTNFKLTFNCSLAVGATQPTCTQS